MIVLANGMSLSDHVLEWKKEDFKKAFGDITHKVNGREGKRYNPDEIYKAVQAYKKANK